MKKLLLWGLTLLLLGGLVVFLVAVPVGGRTVMDRLFARPGKVASGVSAKEAAVPVHPGGTAVGKPPKPGLPPETDQLTDRDRKDLDRLIDSKLKGAGEGTPSSKPR